MLNIYLNITLVVRNGAPVARLLDIVGNHASLSGAPIDAHEILAIAHLLSVCVLLLVLLCIVEVLIAPFWMVAPMLRLIKSFAVLDQLQYSHLSLKWECDRPGSGSSQYSGLDSAGSCHPRPTRSSPDCRRARVGILECLN